MAKKKRNEENGRGSSPITAEQLAAEIGAAQDELNASLNDAVRDNDDPRAGMQKIKNPISCLSCLIYFIVFVVLTLLVAFFVMWVAIDKFNINTVVTDILDKLGIAEFFRKMYDWFAGLFEKNSEVISGI